MELRSPLTCCRKSVAILLTNKLRFDADLCAFVRDPEFANPDGTPYGSAI